MLKSTANLLIALLILISTCSCSSDVARDENPEYTLKNVTTYEEKEIGAAIGFTYPGMNLAVDSNNNIIVNDNRDKESFCVIYNNNGNKIKEYKNDAAAGTATLFTVDAQNNRYVLYEKYDDKKVNKTDVEIDYTLNVYSSTGVKKKSCSLGRKMVTKRQSGITDIAVDSKGNVYLLLRRDVIWVFGNDGKKIEEFPANQVDYIELNEADNLITGYYNEISGHSFIEEQDNLNDKSIWRKELAPGHNLQGMKYDFKTKKLNLLTDKGILACSNDGKFEGYVFNIEKSSLVGSNILISDFAFNSNKSIYFLAYKSDLTASGKSYPLLYSYTPVKDKNISKDEKSLTIAVRYSEKLIESAVAKFEKENPGIKIVLKDYSAATMGIGEEEQERAQEAEDEYRKAIATGLMAGNSADIIDIYGLPYKKYADKNALLDLSEIISNDKEFNLDNYRQSLFNACKYKDKLFIMPINFYMDKLCANKDILEKEGVSIDSSRWTWKEFLEIAQKITKDNNGDGVKDQFALPKVSAKKMLEDIFNSEYEKFIDPDKKTANFNSYEFINLLKFTKEFLEKQVCNPKISISEVYKMKDHGTIGFMDGALCTYQSTVLYQQLLNGGVEYLSMPSYSGIASHKNFIPNRAFAINRNSKMPAEAWKFIKILLSDELQSSQYMYYFPVNNKALNNKAADEIAQNNIYKSNEKSKIYRKVKPLTPEMVSAVNNMIGELNSIPYADPEINKIVTDIAEEYFSGKMTAEEVANIIQSKISIYLGE